MATFTTADRIGGIGGYIGGIGTILDAVHGGMGMPSQYVTKEEAELQHQLSAKDSEIALLKADQASEIKMTEVYRQAHDEIVALRDKVDANQKEQYGINAAQAVINAQVASNIAVDQNNIASIQKTLCDLTKTIIPITNVCPEPMKAYNSWTAPT